MTKPLVSLQLCKARTELESRITEHDHGVVEGFDKPEVTLQVRCSLRQIEELLGSQLKVLYRRAVEK